jgi:hypothetical protein
VEGAVAGAGEVVEGVEAEGVGAGGAEAEALGGFFSLQERERRHRRQRRQEIYRY